jgi:uncharacterized membrane-anchored protein YjiN (DUF445 family)
VLRAEIERNAIERLRAIDFAELIGSCPELRDSLSDGWDQFIAFVHTDVAREGIIIRPGFESFLADVAARVQHDAELRARINHWLADAAASMTDRYRHAVASFVAEQVKSWDTQQAVRTIELSVGKDLQYIRINGGPMGSHESGALAIG